MKKEKTITIDPIKIKYATICVEGDGDLVLNKMHARAARTLSADDRKKIKEVPNIWEDIITAVHWRDGYPVKDTYTELTEEHLFKMLTENAPCISGFGLKKTWGQAVVRNEIDTYATKFDNAVNVVSHLVPIKFAEHYVDKKLIPDKKSKVPLTTLLNRFSGWSAEIPIAYTEHVYSLEQIANIINMAGFGLGIGSGRTSGYGRYHIVDIK